MGKGSNVQKAAQARERNAKDKSKTPEERAAALAKAKKDAEAFICKVCKQAFMVNARPPVLYQHVTAKHPAGIDPASCFDVLKDFDPNDPKGEKKAAEDASKAAAMKKSAVKKSDDLSMLLDAGLKAPKKKA